MFPSRLSLHFPLKAVERLIAQKLNFRVVEQVAIRQNHIKAGTPSQILETLNLCQHKHHYVVVHSTEERMSVLSAEDLSALRSTLSERDQFPAQRYLSFLEHKGSQLAGSTWCIHCST